jgi:hypothetical protein
MGDVGALALGAALGTVAVIVRQEIVLFIMGGVFVAETLSVMLQVLYFKFTGGKRHLPHGAAAPPLRTGRLEGNPGRRALLDHHHHAGAVRSVHPEAALSALRATARSRPRVSDWASRAWPWRAGARFGARACAWPTAAPCRPDWRRWTDAPLPNCFVGGAFGRSAARRHRTGRLEPRAVDPGRARPPRRAGAACRSPARSSLFAQALRELGVRARRPCILAITGTNGKTTTTTLVGRLCWRACRPRRGCRQHQRRQRSMC